MTHQPNARPPLQGGLTNEELRIALQSKLRRGATYSDQDLTAFALGVEHGMALAATSQSVMAQLCVAIEGLMREFSATTRSKQGALDFAREARAQGLAVLVPAPMRAESSEPRFEEREAGMNSRTLWTDAIDGLPKHGEEVLCKLEDGDEGEPGARVLEVWDEVHPLANVERWVRVADLDAIQMQQSDAQGLHAAICQAVAIGNRSPDLAASVDGRQLLEILRSALDDYANASVHTSQDTPAPRPRHSA